MAKILSPVWSIIRGSIAGTTYLAGPNNQIIARARTAPTNPRTGPQTVIRSALMEAAALWKETMVDDDRNGWSAYAETFEVPGPLGPKKLTGQQAFIMAYSVAKYGKELTGSAASVGIDAPIITGLVDVGSYNLVARVNAGTGFQLNAINYGSEDAIIYVQHSNAWDSSKHFFVGPWNPNEMDQFEIAHDTSTSFDIDVDQEGARYFFRIRAVSMDPPLRTQSALIVNGLSTTVAP